jgi:DNA topoisomerase-1
MIAKFYERFHPVVVEVGGEKGERPEDRELGLDPVSGRPVIARLGRFGPMVQMGARDDEDKKFAPMPPGTMIHNVTLEQALEMFRLPRTLGETPDGKEITTNAGRFGPYIKWNGLYASIKPDDPFTITLERALELVVEKEAAEANKYIKQFEGTTVAIVNGRYGPYITDGKKNAKIPKDTAPESIDLAQAQALIGAAPAKSKRRRIVKS